ncbi:exodeoxyribonuclease VII large subunit [Candidatus Epulonipiscium fishelsonii]|uniref:Exodeoxyribonuclease VII large subunit n=1 Tax=Candidatus Epulonipiscium fishelsonii TaxID=77094 RepID=A0ACC8XHL7_9FIRM|nr:exodeoxyribonuclease VII large subunit [Epulopiscium sp. SCG-D08WGA-EpuloA1]OON97341.1 MAG: exodeoxyribonuclease VII large subunit [Epulopiscium sp. AS2M-Bin002]
MNRQAISVSDLNFYVSRMLKSECFLHDIWILGEISNCIYQTSGHIYFNLKDEYAIINSVMFNKEASDLDFKLKDGIKVFVKARIDLYEKSGRYQAYISKIEQFGTGDVYNKFEKLKLKLQEEGLFENKKQIPTLPQKVGVITSSTGAALQDILNITKRRNSFIGIYIYHTLVQGENAPEEIMHQIKQANKDNFVDVLILARGGGSKEDLWVFNDENLARCIYNSRIPIVSAIGHETDFTIADFVSDLRTPTPSAAAEVVFPSATLYKDKIQHYIKTLQQTISYDLAGYQTKLEQLSIAVTNMYKQKIAQCEQKYINNLNQLEKLSPIATLSRGYSYVTSRSKIINVADNINVGDNLNIILSNGEIEAYVKKVVKNNV